MEKLKIALAGCRGHVKKFGNLINGFSESETVAVWDNVPGRGEKVAENLGIAFEPNYDRLLSEYGLNGVIIPAENSIHCELVTKAAAAGVSVFLEKPLCMSMTEAKVMQKAIHETDVKFYMSDPFVRRGTLQLKKLIDDGVLGDITGATFRLGTGGAVKGFVDYDKSHQQGGIMADVGGHMIHKAHFLFGKPERLSASFFYYTDAAKKTGIEEKALVAMEYADGKSVSMECSWLSGGASNLELIYGTRGYAKVHPADGEEGNEIVIYQVGRDAPVTMEVSELPPNPTRHVRYFIEMMLHDIPNDQVGVDSLSNSGVSIDNAVEYVEMIDAIYQSANKGMRTVGIPDSE